MVYNCRAWLLVLENPPSPLFKGEQSSFWKKLEQKGSKTVSAYASGVCGRNTVCKTTELPLEKGAGGIFRTDI